MGRPKKADAKREKVEATLTKKQKEKLKRYAEKNNISMAAAIEKFVEGLDIDSTD